MEGWILAVTVASLVLALIMSVVAWRMAREERRRSSARVAALSSAAAGVDSVAAPAEGSKAPWARSTRFAGIDKPKGLSPQREGLPPQPAGLSLQDESRRPLRPILGTTEDPQVSQGGQRGLAAAAAVLFVVLMGGLAWMVAGRGPSAATAASPGAPLELVSLRHERQTSKLAVSGLVRNPAAGQPVDHLSAVVFLFDQQGSFVTSAKAPVDFVRLGSGDESPFVITMDAPASIARYRVSFRTDSGVVPHVDRRGASPIAAQAEQAASLPVK
jgi:Flp pilus assembly protein TadB